MVSDPAECVFSGYNEACAGRVTARKGLAIALERSGKQADWNTVGAEYRKLLYGVGVEQGLSEDGSPTRPGFIRDEILAEMEAGGQLPLWKTLRCRIRYFADGGVFGSDEFLEQHFERKRVTTARSGRPGLRRCETPAGADRGCYATCEWMSLGDLPITIFSSLEFFDVREVLVTPSRSLGDQEVNLTDIRDKNPILGRQRLPLPTA